jgi:hypothetical protein
MPVLKNRVPRNTEGGFLPWATKVRRGKNNRTIRSRHWNGPAVPNALARGQVGPAGASTNFIALRL